MAGNSLWGYRDNRTFFLLKQTVPQCSSHKPDSTVSLQTCRAVQLDYTTIPQPTGSMTCKKVCLGQVCSGDSGKQMSKKSKHTSESLWQPRKLLSVLEKDTLFLNGAAWYINAQCRQEGKQVWGEIGVSPFSVSLLKGGREREKWASC